MMGKKKKQINYKVFLYTGISFFGAGIVYFVNVNRGLGIAFFAIGISHIMISLSNKDKWVKNKR